MAFNGYRCNSVRLDIFEKLLQGRIGLGGWDRFVVIEINSELLLCVNGNKTKQDQKDDGCSHAAGFGFNLLKFDEKGWVAGSENRVNIFNPVFYNEFSAYWNDPYKALK